MDTLSLPKSSLSSPLARRGGHSPATGMQLAAGLALQGAPSYTWVLRAEPELQRQHWVREGRVRRGSQLLLPWLHCALGTAGSQAWADPTCQVDRLK